MSINWIATNPKQNVKNQANQASMPDSEFTQLMRIIIHNRDNYEEKLEILLQTIGFFSAEQASQLLSTFARPKDKLKAVMILEPKLVSMTSQEASHILAAISIPEDRLHALEFVKRAINDANTQEGQDYIVSSFTFEEHKLIAARILSTVVGKKGVQIAAGGHLGYAPMGCLYTNAAPNDSHIYGPIIDQVRSLPNHRADIDDDYSSKSYVPVRSTRIYNSNLSENLNKSYETNPNMYSGHKEYLDPNKIRSTYA